MSRQLGKKNPTFVAEYGSAHEYARHLAIHDGLTNQEKGFLNEYFDSKGRKSFTPSKKKSAKLKNKLEKFMRPTSMYFLFCYKLEAGFNISEAMAEIASRYDCDISTARKIIKPYRDKYGDILLNLE